MPFNASGSQETLESLELTRSRLMRLLASSFSLQELKTLCFEIGIDFDELPGQTKTEKSRELILHLERRNKLDGLIAAAERTHSQIQWRTFVKSDSRCPYRGLMSFTETDASLFFGREKFTEQLVTLVNKQNFVAVVGPSGSGKSSLIFAGLIPILRQQDKWLIASFRPGQQPFHGLAQSLIDLLEPPGGEAERLLEIRKLGTAVGNGEIPLADILDRVMQKNLEMDHFLLIIDQFEELYTNCPEAETRQLFLEKILTLIFPLKINVWSKKTCTLLIVLRGDFMGHVLANRSFSDALQDSDLKLGPMTPKELELAISRPATLAGLTFEAGLIQRILDDVGADRPQQMDQGSLPLLEFALEQLWALQTEDGRLTHAAYEAIGEVGGAISRYADEVFEGMSPPEQALMRRVLVQMVHPGMKTEDTRRLVTRQEIGNRSWPIVRQLAENRLVLTDWDTTGHEVAEVVHEALILQWARMREWLVVDRDFRIWQEKVRIYFAQWLLSRDENDLLSGMLVSESKAWLQNKPENLTQSEIEYIELSISADKNVRRRLMLVQVIAGGVGAAVIAAVAMALALFILWQPDVSRFPLPRTSTAFISGMMGGIVGGIQGTMTNLGIVLANRLFLQSSRYPRIFGGMSLGGVTGGLLFLVLRAGGALPVEISLASASVFGFVVFMAGSGGASLLITSEWGKSVTLIRQSLIGTLAASLACLMAVWALYSLGLSFGDPFISTATGYAALEGTVAGGMILGLGIARRVRL